VRDSHIRSTLAWERAIRVVRVASVRLRPGRAELARPLWVERTSRVSERDHLPIATTQTKAAVLARPGLEPNARSWQILARKRTGSKPPALDIPTPIRASL
jgi:hypothetical protein